MLETLAHENRLQFETKRAAMGNMKSQVPSVKLSTAYPNCLELAQENLKFLLRHSINY